MTAKGKRNPVNVKLGTICIRNPEVSRSTRERFMHPELSSTPGVWGFWPYPHCGGGKMKKIILCLSLLLLIGAGLQVSPAPAAVINLFEYNFNVNGTISTTPVGLDSSLFNSTTGLGTLTWKTSTPGSYAFFSFFDHEIDEGTNTFFNETAKGHGNLPSYNPLGPWFWQMEEPGWVWGDLYREFSNLNYENKNGMTNPHEFDDVAMGIGRKFDLAAGQQAIIALTLGLTAPNSEWYLEQFDPDSKASIYFSANFETGPNGVVPLPGTLLLLGIGLLTMAGLRLKLWKYSCLNSDRVNLNLDSEDKDQV